MKLRSWNMITTVAALAIALALTVGCQLDGESASEPTSVNTAGISAGNAALFGVAQGAQQRASMAVAADGQGQIQVSGHGKVSIEPDLAILNLGVEAMRPSVSEARNEAATAMNAVMEALKSAGVEDKDIQTRRFNIRAERDWQEVTENGVRTSKSVLVGYRVNNTLIVKARDLDNLDALIDSAVEAGGDAIRFDGLSFTAEDLSSVTAQLREDAVNDARSKAEHFAELAEVSLGNLIFISDGTVAGPLNREYLESRAFAAAAPAYDTSISVGELEVNMSIQTVFTIE